MKTIKKIDTINNTILLEDFTLKLIDNYLLELEDKLIEIEDILNRYIPKNDDMCRALNEIEEIIRK